MISMRYIVRCHNCSHGDVRCDELPQEQRCTHCGSVPSSYVDNGVEYCWLHREKIAGSYAVSANFLFTSYTWRGGEWQFPNAKLYEAASGETISGYSGFCVKCQQALEEWLAENFRHDR